jgi:hypothetical protein
MMNMYPHAITIYHYEVIDGVDNYRKTVLDGVYVYGDEGLTKSGNGIANESTVTVEIPKMYADIYGTKWNVSRNDRLLVGKGKTISSYKEIPTAYTVQSVAINRLGSPLDNITITAR